MAHRARAKPVRQVSRHSSLADRQALGQLPAAELRQRTIPVGTFDQRTTSRSCDIFAIQVPLQQVDSSVYGFKNRSM
jgi:hypothetical protein